MAEVWGQFLVDTPELVFNVDVEYSQPEAWLAKLADKSSNSWVTEVIETAVQE